MKGKNIMLFVVALLAVSMVSALDLSIDRVEVDDRELSPTSTNKVSAFDRGNEFEVRVEVTADEDIDDAQIEVYMRGYDHDDRVEDISDVFDMKNGTSYDEKFTLRFPDRMDKDRYSLRVRVESRSGEGITETYELEIESERHDINIKDVVFSPSNEVLAGRSLLTTVRLKNVGMVDQDDGVKVSITVPELGISAADYIDEVDEDDSITSEELYLRIPACTEGGVYEAIIEVEYDDGDEVESVKKSLVVVEDESCNAAEEPAQAQPKTVITVGPTSQAVVAGADGVIYPLTLSNAGSQARTYVITADGYANWADVTVSPANIVVLQPGEAKALYVQLAAKEDAQAGEHMFLLRVTSGAETLKEFTLKAVVEEAEEEEQAQSESIMSNWSSIKKVLEIGLVVLVVLLVILGLIIGFSRLRGKDDDMDDDDSRSETYY